jgi:uncharacterized SAM-binding protein YcdF (DUF218 family)
VRPQQVLIVLGATNNAEGSLSPLAVARIERARRFLVNHLDYAVILTGGHGAHFNISDKPHAHYLAAYLLERGVEQRRILALVPSRHTVEDATLSKGVVDEYNLEKLTILTSRFHLRRARFIFEQVFGPGYTLGFVGATAPVGVVKLIGLYRHEFRRTAELKRSGFSNPKP